MQTDPTLLGPTMLWLVASVCIGTTTMLALVAYSLKPVKLLGPCKRTQHCWPTTPNNVGSCWHLLRPFALAFWSAKQHAKWNAWLNWITCLRFFELCKNQSFETNRFTRSKQSGSASRQKTCMRWILIHLNSEFHAMLSWTLLDMLARLNEEKKLNWPNYLLPIAWTLIWNLQLRVTAITLFSLISFTRTKRSIITG